MDGFHRTEQFLCCSCFDGFGEDCVAILIVGNHDVLVTSAGFCWESPRLIGEELAGNMYAMYCNHVLSDVVPRGVCRHFTWCRCRRRFFYLCRPDVLSNLSHVALCCCDGFWEMFADCL